MALTAEQHAIRATGIAASEIAAVAGLNPFASPIDVWLQKPTASRAAIIPEQDPFGPTDVGSILEPAVLELYTLRTGNKATRCQETLRHPTVEWVLASPDAFVDAEHLVEVKCVGPRMAADWDEGPPSYVYCQALWQMFVTGAQVVDVVALLGPTEFPSIWPVARNDELINDLAEIGRAFWFNHVLPDIPPPPTPDEDRAEYLAKRFRQLRGELLVPEGDVLARVQALHLSERGYKAEVDRATARLDGVRCELKEIIGEHAGVSLPDGSRYAWKAPASGSVSYKAVAQDLAEFGVIPAAILAKHTSAPVRRFEFYPPSKRKGGK
jgi:putative phage-type endonuclease